MSISYYLIWRTRTGVKVAEIDDYWSLAYRKQVNAPGLLTFEMDMQSPKLTLLEDDAQVEVRRSDLPYAVEEVDFYGLYRAQERRFTDHGTIKITCPGHMAILGDRYVAWYAGTNNRSSFSTVAAETIMKTLVSYNAGSAATTGNGRLRTGTITGLSVQTDGAAGTTLSWSCAWKNLLGELQDVALVAGGDFDLIKTGANTWEFRFYPGQRGTDRTSGSNKVVFGLDYGNMGNPVYSRNRLQESTVAIVAGQGEGSSRAIAIRTGMNYSATNDREIFVDARQETTGAGLDSKGDQALKDVEARKVFSYDVIQTPRSRYNVQYFLGDLVVAQFQDIVVQQQVYAVDISFTNDGTETIAIEMRTR